MLAEHHSLLRFRSGNSGHHTIMKNYRNQTTSWNCGLKFCLPPEVRTLVLWKLFDHILLHAHLYLLNYDERQST